MSERGLGRGLDRLIEQNATELGFLDAYGPTPEEALGGIRCGMPCPQRAQWNTDRGCVRNRTLLLQREADGTRFTWRGQHLPLVASDLRLPGMREGMLSDARDKAEVTFVDWTLDVRRCLERVVEHHSGPS